MAGFSKSTFVQTLRARGLPPYGQGACAAFVAKALLDAGLDMSGKPVPAKDYGPFLLRKGFAEVAQANYVKQIGDIAVFNYEPNGHIEGWDGRNWISDFIQPMFYPSHARENARTPYKIYRYP